MLQRVLGCQIQHPSISDAELVARSWFQLLSKAVLQSVLLPYRTHCSCHHCFNVSLSSHLLLENGIKNPCSSCSIIHLSSLSSSNLSGASALWASRRQWLKLWNLSSILSPLTLLVNVKPHVCIITKRKSDDWWQDLNWFELCWKT